MQTQFSRQQFRAARNAAGFNRDRLAHELGMTAQGIHYWELGRTTPRVEVLCRAVDVLGVPIQAVFERVEVEPTDEGGR